MEVLKKIKTEIGKQIPHYLKTKIVKKFIIVASVPFTCLFYFNGYRKKLRNRNKEEFY